MSAFLSHLSRACIALLLLGGVIVSFGQIAGIAFGNASIVIALGTTGVSVISTIAGLAAIFAFVRSYGRQGRADQENAATED